MRTVIWVIKQCSLEGSYQCFGEMYNILLPTRLPSIATQNTTIHTSITPKIRNLKKKQDYVVNVSFW